MSETDSQLDFKTRQKKVEDNIRQLWLPDAHQVESLIDAGNFLVVVDAPGGSGKTTDLIPLLLHPTHDRSWTASSVDLRSVKLKDLEDPHNYLAPPTSPSTHSLILDEADDIPDSAINTTLEFARQTGLLALVPLIRESENPQTRKNRVQKWLQSANDLSQKAAVMEMVPRQLPPDLALEFLVTRHRVPLPEPLAREMLRYFPAYPRLLSNIARILSTTIEYPNVQMTDVRQVFHGWAHLSPGDFGLTEEEYTEISLKLMELES